MDCTLVKETLPSYVAGEATAIEQRVISEHLETCSDCRSLAKDFEQTWKFLDTWESPTPPALAPYRFHKSLKERIREQQETEPLPTFERVLRRYSFWVRGWQAISVPAFATLITLAFFWGIDWDAKSSIQNMNWGSRPPTYVSSTASAVNTPDGTSSEASVPAVAPAQGTNPREEVARMFTVVNYESPSGALGRPARLPAGHNSNYY